MPNFQQPHSNSLFALEQSLQQLARLAAQPQQLRAQAFDWDEAIELQYEEDAYPTAMEADAQDKTQNGEQNPDADDDAPQPENSAVKSASFSHANSLFALEQQLFQTTSSGNPAHSSAQARQQVQAQAFDWDEAIELQYDDDPQSAAMAFDWLPTDDGSESFGLGDALSTFEVEAFEVPDEDSAESPETISSNDEAVAASVDNSWAFEADNSNYGYGYQNHDQSHYSNAYDHGYDYGYTDRSNSTAFESESGSATPALSHLADDDQPAIPVPVTIAPPSSPPQKSAQPDALGFDFDQFDNAPEEEDDRAADAKGFEADLAAILRGEKTYEPPAEPTPAPAPSPFSQSKSASSTPKADPHEVFNQMGRSMAHATAFDLGTFSLEQRFDEFDDALDQEEEAYSRVKQVSAPSQQTYDVSARAVVDPAGEADSEAMAWDDASDVAMALADIDVIDDLERIDAAAEQQLGVAMSRTQKDATDEMNRVFNQTKKTSSTKASPAKKLNPQPPKQPQPQPQLESESESDSESESEPQDDRSQEQQEQEKEDAINHLSQVTKDFTQLRQEVASNRDFPMALFNEVREMTNSLEGTLKPDRINSVSLNELLAISLKAAVLRQKIAKFRPKLTPQERRDRFMNDFDRQLRFSVNEERWERGKKHGGMVEMQVPKASREWIYQKYHNQLIDPQKSAWTRKKKGEEVKYYVTETSLSIPSPGGFDISGHIWNGEQEVLNKDKEPKPETVFVLHVHYENA